MGQSYSLIVVSQIVLIDCCVSSSSLFPHSSLATIIYSMMHLLAVAKDLACIFFRKSIKSPQIRQPKQSATFSGKKTSRNKPIAVSPTLLLLPSTLRCIRQRRRQIWAVFMTESQSTHHKFYPPQQSRTSFRPSKHNLDKMGATLAIPSSPHDL